jgi:SPOR domain
MARDWRRLAIAAIAAAGIATVFAFDAQSQAPAKKAKAQAPAPQAQEDGEQAEEQQDAAPKAAAKRKKQDPVEAQRAIDGALKQLEAGKADQAVTALSATLAGGNLPPAIMAKALLYRGVAYRQQKKPAQAIADLTSALWLKGGLSDNDRKDALRQRASAYQEAGLTETGEVVAPAVPSAAVAHAPASPPAAPTRTAAASRPWSAETIQWPSQPPAAQPSQQSSGWNLFGSLFGSPAPAAQTPPPPLPTVVAAAPVERPEPAPVVRRQAEARPAAATSGWSSGTEAQSAQAPIVTGALPQARSDGRFRIQVGIVRTQGEADALVAKIKQEHGPLLASRETEVDQTVVGNMGSFYRVRVGPFATQQETNVICARLKGTGLDCLVVAQ